MSKQTVGYTSLEFQRYKVGSYQHIHGTESHETRWDHQGNGNKERKSKGVVQY